MYTVPVPEEKFNQDARLRLGEAIYLLGYLSTTTPPSPAPVGSSISPGPDIRMSRARPAHVPPAAQPMRHARRVLCAIHGSTIVPPAAQPI